MFSHFFRSSRSHNSYKAQAGFSLIELMVSIGMSVIMIRQSSFNGAVLLRSQAYEIALTLRDLQLNAVSAYGDGGTFRGESYGVHFQTGDLYDGFYEIFKDATPPDGYDSGEEFGEQGYLDPRFRISSIEVGGNPVSELSVVFTRPDFDATFFVGSNTTPDSATSVTIVIERRGSSGSGRDSVRLIEITSAGQIAVLTDS